MSDSSHGEGHFWQHTFLGSDRMMARTIARPVARFLHIEAAAGILLLVGAVVAVIWANSPWKESYLHLLHTEAGIDIGSFSLHLDLQEWVNDGLMTLFFFVVGMEIKREVVMGDLRDRRTAALPVIAALGGMLVPALIYTGFNAGGEAAGGWGIPMATDIAFAVGIVSLLGSRVPVQLKLFLLTLAVADDLGAIAVIALFYTDDIDLVWLGVGVGMLGLAYVARRAHIWYVPVYVGIGLVAWYAVLQSGVHATVAGVILGFITPMVALRPDLDAEAIADSLEGRDLSPADVRAAAFELNESVPIAVRLIDWLHPWTAYVIIPLFALFNAGVVLSGDAIGAAFGSTITLGIFFGLVVGKTVGVSSFAWLAAKTGIGRLPRGVGLGQLIGIASAAGIGFTVAIFVTELSFDSEVFKEEAKIGIFAASILAGIVSSIVLSLAGRRVKPGDAELMRMEEERFFSDQASPSTAAR
ncbi:MAG: Na+/H+ antiporter NhaA [Acidimicrobiales bacterium]